MNTEKVLKNGTVAFICSTILALAGFLLQRVMAQTLGQAYLGLNSVFTSIISFVSLAELGFSTAVIYHMYAPLNRHDEEMLAGLMKLYSQIYHIVAVTVLIIGLALMPFLQYFLKNSSFPIRYSRLVFSLFVLNAVIGYFLSYKRSIFTADQKMYFLNLVDLAGNSIRIFGGIAILKITGSYVQYLILWVFTTLLRNIVIYFAANRDYPYIAKKAEHGIDPKVKKEIFLNVRDIFIARISSLILEYGDSLIISSFVSLNSAGLYSNYYLILAGLRSMGTAVQQSIQPSLGNQVAKGNLDDVYRTIRQYLFIWFMIISFCCVSFLCLITPFVTQFWLSPQYEMNFACVAVCALNLFLDFINGPIWSLLSASGLFLKNRNISLLGASLNLGSSIVLVQKLGIMGDLLGNAIAQTAQFILRTILICHDLMKRSSKTLFTDCGEYMGLFLVEGALSYWCCSLIQNFGNLGNFGLKFLVCLLVPNGINCLVYFKTERFKTSIAKLKNLRKTKAKV